MKSKFFPFLLFSLLTLGSACDKEKPNTPPGDPGEGSGGGAGHRGETREWKADDLRGAADKALSRLETELGPLAVTEVKSWNAKENIAVKVTYLKDRNKEIRPFLCHLHGSTLSCHKTKEVAPGEPVGLTE